MTTTRSLRRRSTLRVAAAAPAVLMLLGASVPAQTGISTQASPSESAEATLRGRLVDSTGKPLQRAELRLFINPPNGGPAVEYYKGTTGPDGTYAATLNADKLRPYAKAGGLVDLIAIPQGESQEVGVPQYATVRLNNSSDAILSTDGSPTLLLDARTQRSPQPTIEAGTMTASSGATCYVGPIKWETVPGNDVAVSVGWHQLAAGAPNWTSSVTYKNTKSSSTTTGFAGVLGYSALSFSVNGSTTTDSSASASGTNYFGGSSNNTVNRRQTITTASYTDVYRCWPYTSPPPAYQGNWPVWGVVARTGPWLRDYYATNFDGWPNMSCTGADSTYGPGQFTRTVGQSLTLSNTISLGVTASGLSGTFTGSATVSMSSTSGKEVSQTMNNTSTGNKKLCGSNNQNLAAAANVGVVVGKP